MASDWPLNAPNESKAGIRDFLRMSEIETRQVVGRVIMS